jgi:hypothetical protein
MLRLLKVSIGKISKVWHMIFKVENLFTDHLSPSIPSLSQTYEDLVRNASTFLL